MGENWFYCDNIINIVLKFISSNFRFGFSVFFGTTGPAAVRSVSLPPSLLLRVSPQSQACISRPGGTFLECLIGTATSREDDGLHTARLRSGPSCSSGPHGGERSVRAGRHPTAGAATAAQHRKSSRGFQDGPGDEDNRQHWRPRWAV